VRKREEQISFENDSRLKALLRDAPGGTEDTLVEGVIAERSGREQDVARVLNHLVTDRRGLPVES